MKKSLNFVRCAVQTHILSIFFTQMKTALKTLLTIKTLTCILPNAYASDTNRFLWPYNQPTNIVFDIADLENAYHTYKTTRITTNNTGGNGRYRVMGGVSENTSVSEGIAYGMILTSLFDDQQEFDGLWLFAKDHFDDQNLMHWHIGNPGQLIGTGAATDGDVDMAIALVNACVKQQQGAWPASSVGIDYCLDARQLIDNIYAYEVDQPGTLPFSGLDNNIGGELMPGDSWYLQTNYPNGIVNLSYFPPGFFRVFGKFTGQQQKWQNVIDRNYALVDQVQAKPGNCSGLVPNWNTYAGDVQVVPWQPNNSGWWSYDAARFGWRIAVDAHWYSDNNATATVNELGSFFASVGMDNLWGEYALNGTRAGNAAWSFFYANAAAPIFAATTLTPINCGDATASIKSNAQQAYNKLLSNGGNLGDYYGPYWRLVAMMLMTGNFPNLYEMVNDTSPYVAITSPQNNDTIEPGQTIVVKATASDNEQVTEVEFFVDDNSVGKDATSPYQITLSSITEGTHSVYAVATDNENNKTQSGTVNFIVATSPVDTIRCEIVSKDVWESGYVLNNITVTNSGNQPITSWSVKLKFNQPPRIVNSWNAILSVDGNTVVATNAYPVNLAPGQSSTFGLQGKHNGSFAVPECVESQLGPN